MSDANISKIIDEIYGSIVAPEAWQSLVGRIADELRADSALLSSPALPGCEPVPLTGYKFDITAVSGEPLLLYPEFSLRALAKENAPGSYLFDELMPPEEQVTHPYWNRVIKPLGYGSGVLTVIRTADDNRRPVIMGLYREETSPPFEQSDVEIMKELLPHLRRTLGILLDGDPQVGAHDQGLLAPVFYLDRDARVVGMTDAARRLSEADRGVSVAEDGRLSVKEPRLQSELRDALRTAIGKDWSRMFRTGAELAIRTEDGGSLFLIVTPLAADTISATASKIRCAVFVLAAIPVDAATIRRLQRLFGLTPAQSEVAAGVADGESVEGIATRRGTSVLTVRTQLKQVFGKTGARTQAELVGLVHRLR
jgi:DNA-binding CsgD family transcriptional regulator